MEGLRASLVEREGAVPSLEDSILLLQQEISLLAERVQALEVERKDKGG